MLTTEEIKRKLGSYAADLIPAHSVFGLGTGSTITWLIKELGSRVQHGLDIQAVPTSSATKKIAAENGIKLVSLNDIDSLPLTIDGADEIDPGFNMIKGGGGALLQEKMVAAASDQLVIIADETKDVNQLGQFPLPVEVLPLGWKQVQKKIIAIGCDKVTLRLVNNLPSITDNGNYILDCHFSKINDANALNIALHLIPGVVETGLFIDMNPTVVIGFNDGRIEIKQK